MPDTEEIQELFVAFNITCRKCGSDDVVIDLTPEKHYSDDTVSAGSISYGCNACRQNDGIIYL